jgi:hypothetical protein
MKVATILLISLMVCFLPMTAADSVPAGEVAIGFTGGATWTSDSTGICIWYFPVLGNEALESLFVKTPLGAPIVDREHSYFLWVSDFSAELLPATAPHALALVPTGTATVYYTSDPTSRDFTNLADRRSWGTPVATFVRKASILRSPDGFASDTFIFSADLTSTVPFTLNGNRFDFKNFIPNGMTCFESGQAGSSWEAGSCIAKAK